MVDINSLQSFSQTRLKAEKNLIHEQRSRSSDSEGALKSESALSAASLESENSVSAMKQQFNQAILSSQMNASVKSGNEPLALLYKTAIEGINEVLKESLGEDNSIQKAYDSGVDFSPEATAERIVSFSTRFYGQYREQHPELSESDAAQSFVDLINGGVDRGFSEARDILDSLNVLQGDIASNIDKTYDLVQEGFKNFLDSFQVTDSKDQVTKSDSEA